MTFRNIITANTAIINDPQASNSQKAELYYLNIFIKNSEGDSEVYIDIKNFLQYYLQSIDEKNFGYESVNVNKVISCFNLLNVEKRIGILKFYKNLLHKFHLSDDWVNYEGYLYQAKNDIIKNKPYWYLNPLNIFQFLFNKCLYSFGYLLLALVVIIVVDFLILLPNGNTWPSLFIITYQDISSNFFLNHLGNVLLGLFEINSDFKIEPIGIVGVLALICGKLFKILIVVKYLSSIILKKISLNG